MSSKQNNISYIYSYSFILYTDPPVTQISLIEPKEPRLLREDENAVLLCSADASPPAVNFTFYKGPEVS